MGESKDNKPGRRKFLKTAGLGVLGAGLAVLAARPSKLLGSVTGKSTSKKVRYGMVIDLRKCTGCHACSVACKSEFDVRLGGFRSWVNTVEKGKYPNVKRFFLPRLCNHCEHPSCIDVCPTTASHVREDGVVMIDKTKCIGCRYCIVACPYGARYFNWYKYKSDVPSRERGTPDKCDFCAHRIDKGIVPSCVNTCPGNARIFGDLNDPKSEVAKLVATAPTTVLHPEYGNEPSVFYIGATEEASQGSFKGGR